MLGRFSRLLVVDGANASRQATHLILHQLGYDNIDYVRDGAGALSLLYQHLYRVVIADWDSAPAGGLDLLRAMRAEKRLKRTPFIMVISPAQKKFIEVARDDGVTFYATKPVTSEVLADRLAQIDRGGELPVRPPLRVAAVSIRSGSW